MITQFYVDVPCSCGRNHHVPLDTLGRFAFVCGIARYASRGRVDPAQFATLERNHRESELVLTERVAHVVHKVGEARDDQQRCEDCGWLLLSYRRFRRVHPGEPVAWWRPGDLVACTDDGFRYLAQLPLSPQRERHCFRKVS